jgi:gas vesicle protein
MSPTDTTFNRTQTNASGTKTQEPGKQARDFGREVKGQATELAKTATETVKTQAENLTQSAKDVAADAGEKLRTTLQDQKAAGADYVGNVANIIRRTAYEFDTDIPQAGHYIRKAAAQLENVSEAMRNRNMSEIVGNVQQFARKQPTAFFGAAVLVGFAAIRFLKSGSGDSGDANQVASRSDGPTARM